MDAPNDEIARLDTAARAVISETFISRNRWLFLLINLFLVAAVLASSARFDTPLIAPVFTVCAAVATAILWVDWQYKLYVPALFYFATAIGCVFLGRTFDALSDQIYSNLRHSDVYDFRPRFLETSRPVRDREGIGVGEGALRG